MSALSCSATSSRRSATSTRNSADRSAGTLAHGGVSERSKEHASKACEGATPPWVQIPPPPPNRRSLTCGFTLPTRSKRPVGHRSGHGMFVILDDCADRSLKELRCDDCADSHREQVLHCV